MSVLSMGFTGLGTRHGDKFAGKSETAVPDAVRIGNQRKTRKAGRIALCQRLVRGRAQTIDLPSGGFGPIPGNAAPQGRHAREPGGALYNRDALRRLPAHVPRHPAFSTPSATGRV